MRFNSIEGLRSDAIEKLNEGVAIYTNEAYIRKDAAGKFIVTHWSPETYYSYEGEVVFEQAEDALNSAGLRVPFGKALSEKLASYITEEDAKRIQFGELSESELMEELVGRFTTSLREKVDKDEQDLRERHLEFDFPAVNSPEDGRLLYAVLVGTSAEDSTEILETDEVFVWADSAEIAEDLAESRAIDEKENDYITISASIDADGTYRFFT